MRVVDASKIPVCPTPEEFYKQGGNRYISFQIKFLKGKTAKCKICGKFMGRTNWYFTVTDDSFCNNCHKSGKVIKFVENFVDENNRKTIKN